MSLGLTSALSGAQSAILAAKKVRIEAFSKEDFSGSLGVFNVSINPESYTMDYKVAFNETAGQNNSAKQLNYLNKPPATLQMEFLFDSTGIADMQPRMQVEDEIETFRQLLIGYRGSIHEPPYVTITWGKLIFQGRCDSLNFTYKLFHPNGWPIRAVCKASFTQSVEEKKRVKEEGQQSPDLTHYRVVKDGDTLPLMCYDIYDDAKYYLQVAQANKLSNFRDLKAGMEIFFPPIQKITEE